MLIPHTHKRTQEKLLQARERLAYLCHSHWPYRIEISDRSRWVGQTLETRETARLVARLLDVKGDHPKFGPGNTTGHSFTKLNFKQHRHEDEQTKARRAAHDLHVWQIRCRLSLVKLLNPRLAAASPVVISDGDVVRHVACAVDLFAPVDRLHNDATEAARRPPPSPLPPRWPAHHQIRLDAQLSDSFF